MAKAQTTEDEQVFDLTVLEDGQLTLLEKQIEGERKRRAAEREVLVTDRIAQVAAEFGMSVDKVCELAKVRKTGQPPKYRHPENPQKTWTGKGRRPDWVKEFQNNGGDIETCRIA